MVSLNLKNKNCNLFLTISPTGSFFCHTKLMLFFIPGLRGAVAFALAMRNTESVPRQMMLTSVLIVVLVTVIINGGSTMSVLSFLKIR